ncbi:MAG: pyruvate kinase [Anaerolineales bacterium]|nr:pyruvate kinase [Anaerolineales bacterium]
MKRRTKIVATIGPSTHDQDQLRNLVHAGMDVARLNMSHGSQDQQMEVIRCLRDLSKETGKAIGILLDLQGPKIRTGDLPEGKVVELVQGESVDLVFEPTDRSTSKIVINYPFLYKDLSKGNRVLLDDGSLELRVVKIDGNRIRTEVVTGGHLGSRKGVNVPGVHLRVPSLTEKDKNDVAFGIKAGVDMIALSFIRAADDIIELRNLVIDNSPECEDLPIIAKLEKPEAVERLDEILEQSNGVMVARGDLGVEVSPEKVPSLQKQIIAHAIRHRCFVITATQMLESMIRNPKPSRAEASDVANAIFDGSDALMLSGETAIGDHPIQSVETMERIIVDAEFHREKWGFRSSKRDGATSKDAVATTIAARQLAKDRGADAIAVFTRSGRTAQYMSNVRPEVPIFAFTPENRTYNRMSILWGVKPQLIPHAQTVEEMISLVDASLTSTGECQKGQQVVLIASLPIGAMGPANFTLLHTIE